tara:strand:+ start:1090 stop:1875 length:786 start_codon:yes stop_codon:yes gene_type:complete
MYSQGLVYVATGPDYLREVALSIARSSNYISNLPIAIFTDLDKTARDLGLFDYVFNIDNPFYSYGDKILPMSRSPFTKSLFIDSDTVVISSLSPLFELLDTFDLCASLAPVRSPDGWTSSVPCSLFTEFNTGVLLVRKTKRVKSFICDWHRLYSHLYLTTGQSWDQASFRETLWSYISNHLVNFFALPPECNLRLTKPWIAGKGLEVSVIHGRINDDELPLLASYLNDNVSCFRSWEMWKKLYPNTNLKLKTTVDPRFNSD